MGNHDLLHDGILSSNATIRFLWSHTANRRPQAESYPPRTTTNRLYYMYACLVHSGGIVSRRPQAESYPPRTTTNRLYYMYANPYF